VVTSYEGATVADAIPGVPEIFGDALEIDSAEERLAFLREACGDDTARRAAVETLLSAHAASGAFLETPAAAAAEAGPGRETTSDMGFDPPEIFIPPGMMIGRYKLLEPIGEGGYGVVFMAEQTAPVRRKVALKIIKAGMDTRQVIARFEVERQALALMDHPNIARVFDAGATDTGRPYFVMELVTGMPVTKYCDQHRMPVRARLELFVQVCHAVQHAHTKGVIHRDLKPSNVLVAVYDGKPVPKVIDFGVAKAAGPELTDRATMFTGLGDVIGTLEYMSPEQAEINQLDVDARSDIYALGVLLYELLTGSTPLGNRKHTALLESLRCIREEEPLVPSARLGASDGPNGIAAKRASEPRKLIGLVKGELDWIVMRALEKDRNRRYDTANALAADVQRYLRDEPVEASLPSAWYRFGKFARRNKAVLVTVAVVALAVALAVGSLAVSYLRIDRSLRSEKQATETLVQTLYYQWVAAAAHERGKNRQARAEELLQQCPADLRGWEWHYLRRLPFAGVLKLAHDDIINRVAWSPDGQLLASSGRTGWVKVWDSRSGRMVFAIHAQKEFVRGLAFSPDGRLLATGGDDDAINLWDVQTHQLHRRFPTGAASTMVQALDFSPDGRHLAAAAKDQKVRLWNLTDGEEVILSDDLLATGGLAFTPDGRLVTVSAEGVIKTIDVVARRTLATSSPYTRAAGYVAAFSRDRRLVALGCEDGAVKILSVDPFAEVRTLKAHTGEIANLSFGAGGDRLASTGNDLSVKVWDMRTGQVALALDILERRASGMAFSPDGQRIAVGSADGIVQLLDGTPLNGAGEGGQLLTLEGHDDAVTAVAYSPDGGRAVSASRDGTANVWDSNSGRAALTFRGHRAALTAVAWTSDGRRVASASWDGTARVWDATTGAEVYSHLDARAGPVNGLAFNRDGSALATAHHDGSVRVWDALTGRPIQCIAHAHSLPALGVTFSPDGAHVASAGGADNTVKIWDWRANATEPVRTLRAHENIIRSPAYSPDGRRLVAVVATPARLWTWDTASGEGSFRPLPNSWNTSQAVFDSRGRLAIVSGDRIAFVESDGSDGAVLVGRHAGEIECVAFSPDGRRFASGAGFKGRGEIRIWDASRFAIQPTPSTQREPSTGGAVGEEVKQSGR
jgi:WD40 repeat protein/serine/threonine protein kinase